MLIKLGNLKKNACCKSSQHWFWLKFLLFLYGFVSLTIQMKTYEKGKCDDILSSLLFWHSVTLFFHMASDVVFFHRLLIFPRSLSMSALAASDLFHSWGFNNLTWLALKSTPNPETGSHKHSYQPCDSSVPGQMFSRGHENTHNT